MISCLRKIFLFSAVFVLVSSLKANAISPEIVLKNMQLITPEIKEEKRYIIPQNYSHNNNLRRKSGSPFFAKGQFLYIEGFVFDVVGVPVENAVVKIWQTNHLATTTTSSSTKMTTQNTTLILRTQAHA